jgi:hypothetical protein
MNLSQEFLYLLLTSPFAMAVAFLYSILSSTFLYLATFYTGSFYFLLAEIPGVARDSRKSERIRVTCLSPGSE